MKYVCKLGTFQFPIPPEREITSSFNQELAKIDIPGAKPKYQNMGPGEEAMSFSGILTGENAIKYKDEIKKIQRLGKPVTFSFGPMNEYVSIRSFTPVIRRFDHIKYTLELVIEDKPDEKTTNNKINSKSNAKSTSSKSPYAGKSKFSGKTFIVKPGFYLIHIQKITGVPWQELAKYNKIKDVKKIPNGQKIKIP
jgi:hypothetical protein